MLKLAYFSPLPPAASGIADYSVDLLSHLARWVDITLFTADPTAVAPHLAEQFPVLPLATYPARQWDFDLPLYQMGNSQHHADLYRMSRRFPGALVLHDYFLHHFIAEATVGAGHYPAYTRELAYERGGEGLTLAWAIASGTATHPLFSQPVNGRLLDLSLGVLVHSGYVAGLIAKERPSVPVTIVPQLMTPSQGTSRRTDLPWPADAVIFASFGQITPAKQIPLALQAFRQLHRQLPQARYLLVGGDTPEMPIADLLAELDLTELVHHTGRVATLTEFNDWLHTADVVVNLRHPTIGETSATALRALAAERPLIVFDHGWYREIPEDACYRIPPLNEAHLLAAMGELARSAEKRATLGDNGVAYIRDVCDPAHIGQQYAAWLHDMVGTVGPTDG